MKIWEKKLFTWRLLGSNGGQGWCRKQNMPVRSTPEMTCFLQLGQLLKFSLTHSSLLTYTFTSR